MMQTNQQWMMSIKNRDSVKQCPSSPSATSSTFNVNMIQHACWNSLRGRSFVTYSFTWLTFSPLSNDLLITIGASDTRNTNISSIYVIMANSFLSITLSSSSLFLLLLSRISSSVIVIVFIIKCSMHFKCKYINAMMNGKMVTSTAVIFKISIINYTFISSNTL